MGVFSLRIGGDICHPWLSAVCLQRPTSVLGTSEIGSGETFTQKESNLLFIFSDKERRGRRRMCGEAAEGSSGGEVVEGRGGARGGGFLLKQWKREWEGERRRGGRGNAETNSTPVAGLCSCGCVQRGLVPTGRPPPPPPDPPPPR